MENITLIKKDSKPKKYKILFHIWLNVAHSYAIVNCFQLIHLYKNFSEYIDFYIKEAEYYNPDWNNKKKLVYTEEYNNILKNFKKYNGEHVDLIYRLTYPYNITVTEENRLIPKCVFYTSEFASIDSNYFKVGYPNGIPEESKNTYINSYLNQFNNIFFTSPSVWSSYGIERFIGKGTQRNRIITHGVDTSIFKYNHTKRNSIREHYNIKDTDILLMNIGAMTKNKGMILILQSLNELVNKRGLTQYKLLLKGMGDLYQTRQFLEIYFEELQSNKLLTKEEMNILLDNHLIFADKTFSFDMLNHLYNACDIYISPYLCEGFGMCNLEALTAGAVVVVPETGSTKEYMEDIYKNGSTHFIKYIKSVVLRENNEHPKMSNHIELNDLINTILSCKKEDFNENEYKKMITFIEKDYSWNKVSELLFNYLKDIIDKNIN
jgi:hypothetical protein